MPIQTYKMLNTPPTMTIQNKFLTPPIGVKVDPKIQIPTLGSSSNSSTKSLLPPPVGLKFPVIKFQVLNLPIIPSRTIITGGGGPIINNSASTNIKINEGNKINSLTENKSSFMNANKINSSIISTNSVNSLIEIKINNSAINLSPTTIVHNNQNKINSSIKPSSTPFIPFVNSTNSNRKPLPTPSVNSSSLPSFFDITELDVKKHFFIPGADSESSSGSLPSSALPYEDGLCLNFPSSERLPSPEAKGDYLLEEYLNSHKTDRDPTISRRSSGFSTRATESGWEEEVDEF